MKKGMMMLGLVIVLVVVAMVAGAERQVWGLYELAGILLLVAAGYVFLVKKGKIQLKAHSPFAWCLVLGIALIAVSFLIGESYYIDFSNLFSSLSVAGSSCGNCGPAAVNSPPGGFPA